MRISVCRLIDVSSFEAMRNGIRCRLKSDGSCEKAANQVIFDIIDKSWNLLSKKENSICLELSKLFKLKQIFERTIIKNF